MLLFGHIGITLGVFFVFSYFAPRLKTVIDLKYLAIGALLPDLIDKPLGRVIFSSILSNGRIIGHTLLFSIFILLIGLYLYDNKKDFRIISLASGSFFHLMEDQMWKTPKTLFWPLFGLRFPKDTDNNGIWYLIREFENSFAFHFSQSSIPEFLGIAVIVLLALYWLKDELIKTDSENKKIKDESYEKPETKTASLYILGFIIFGFLFVKAITTL